MFDKKYILLEAFVLKEFGVTIDIGTSRVTLHLVDITAKKVLAESSIDNPQLQFGLDVISRIHVSLESTDSLSLTQTIRESVNNLLMQTLATADISPERVSSVVIVGNSVMHHFFFDLPLESLLNEPYLTTNKDSIETAAVDVGLALNETATCYSPPLVDSFIGNDAIAIILDADMHSNEEASLALDVGTNTEIVLSNNGSLWAASAASGPAFEGMTLECGMPAIDGAIKEVYIDPETYAPKIDTIGSISPIGICGTGAISTVASLLETGLVNNEGSFDRTISSKWITRVGSIIKYLLTAQSHLLGHSSISLSQPDVRLLQHSKASIRAAVEVLFRQSDCDIGTISKLYITGAFGSKAEIRDLTRIGMLPDLPNATVTQTFGGAIRGADQLLLQDSLRDLANDLAKAIKYIDLSTAEEYKILHVESMFFPERAQ
ncbi:MAG: ASKHA domain-containing protein [Candidatus Thorarchaeota archaeon]